MGGFPGPELLAQLFCTPGLGHVCPLSQGRAPKGSEDRVPVSPARMCLTLGCLCRLRQPLKQKVTLIYGPWIYGRYISRHSVIAFLWPVSGGGHPGVSESRDSCGSTHRCHCWNSFTSAAGKGQSCHYPRVPEVLILCWEEAGSGIQSPLASGSEWEMEEGEISQSATQPTPCSSCRTLLQCPVCAHPLSVLLTPPRAGTQSWCCSWALSASWPSPGDLSQGVPSGTATSRCSCL